MAIYPNEVDLRLIDSTLLSLKTSLERASEAVISYNDEQWPIISRLILKIEEAKLNSRRILDDRISRSESRHRYLVYLSGELKNLVEDSTYFDIASNSNFHRSPRSSTKQSAKSPFIDLYESEFSRKLSIIQATESIIHIIDISIANIESAGIFSDKGTDNLSDVEILKSIIPAQKVAPAQFEITNNKLSILHRGNRINPDDIDNIRAAKNILFEEGKNIIKKLKESNSDNRLIENFENLQNELVSDDNIIRLALTNITCEMAREGCAHELNDITNSMFQAHTRKIEMFAAQFPEWNKFVQNAAAVNINQDDVEDIKSSTSKIIKELEIHKDIVDPEVPKTFYMMREALKSPGLASKRAAFALIRSIENLANRIFSYGADYIDQTAKKTIEGLSTTTSKLMIRGLLALALTSAYQLSPIAGKIPELTWLRSASEIIQKQMDKVIKE